MRRGKIMRKTKIEIRGKSYDCYSIENVIVGSGAAGLNAAVSLYKEGKSDIAIITEGRAMGTSRNTGSDKQTYYKLSTSGEDSDSVRQMAQTLYDGLCMDGDLAMVEASTSARAFFHLVDIGVPFPHNAFGEYVGYKTDHDPFSRGTSAGPLTSKFMTEALWKEVERCGIEVFDGYQVIELLKEEGDDCDRVRGLVTVTNKGGIGTYVFFSVNNVIYATGGEAGMVREDMWSTWDPCPPMYLLPTVLHTVRQRLLLRCLHRCMQRDLQAREFMSTLSDPASSTQR